MTMKQSTFNWLKQTATYTSLLLLGTGIGFGGNYLLNSPQLWARTPETQEVSPEKPTTTSNLSLTTNNPNFVTQVVQEVGPAVVRINASRTIDAQLPPIFNDPFWQRFFGDKIPQIPEQQIQQGTGSGFIISTDGKILTNAHVVDGATEVTVNLKDGHSFDGKVVGTDPLTDLAVIQIEADNLPIVRLGDSESLAIGEWAIAIGNPLGLDNTVTTGIISATGRSSSQIGVPDKRIDFIQTDAAINPGNSGGPLLNAKGEVIGINTAIIQNAQGLGFAIPIHKAEAIAAQLIATGKVEHTYLGIQMGSLTPAVKQQLAKNEALPVEADKGVLIVKVMPNSPAAQAGLKSGDVIQNINGQAITDASAVQKAVEETPVGKNLSLQLRRNQETIKLKVKVGVLPVS
jgi:Do/DeqQ family serine protease